MAWVTEYDLVWNGDKDYGTISIQRDGGSYKKSLKLKHGTLEVRRSIQDWETHVAHSNCSFVVVNDGEDVSTWQELLPLMTISDGQYRVVVVQDGKLAGDFTLFMGYINCEAVNQNMMYFSELRITASGLLNKLQYVEPVGITDPIQNTSLINIIDYCLRQTGTEQNIRVMCSLEEDSAGGYAILETLFSESGVNTELFWVDNIKRKSALEILEMILAPFNCYLYWFQDIWYIDYYEDLGIEDRTYIEYTTGQSYGVGDEGYGLVYPTNVWQVYSAINKSIADTQIMSVHPGMKQVEITLQQKQFFNMVDGSMTVMEEGTSPEDVYYRTWYGQDSGIFWNGETKLGEPNNVYPVPWLTIANAFGRIIQYDTATPSWDGLHTRFKCTIYPDSEITIDWKTVTKILPDESHFGNDSESDTFYTNPESVDVRFYWTAYINGTSQYIAYDPDAGVGEEWSLEATQPANYLEVTAGAFDLKRTAYDPSISIPIGNEDNFPTLADFSSTMEPVTLDVTIIIGMTVLLCDDNVYWPLTSRPDESAPMKSEYIGDVNVSITGSPEPNIITGDTISNFLDKKEIDISLFDTENWNYRNSIMIDTDGTHDYVNKTSLWTGGSATSVPLVDALMSSKFRLYRIARQKITLRTHIDTALLNYQFRIGEVWEDSKQPTLKFVMMGDTHYPDQSEHAFVLFEYDDAEEITLIG